MKHCRHLGRCVDVRIARKFRLHSFSGNFGPYELRMFVVVYDKGIDVYISRKFFASYVRLLINAYLATHCVYHCQVIVELWVC